MSIFTNEETLVVPETELHGCRGFALHIGSSLVKFAYIGQLERHESLNPEFSKVSIELKTTTKDKLDDVIKFIKDNILEQRKGRHPYRFQAILTGWHGFEYKQKLHEELGVNIKLIDPCSSYAKYQQYGVCDIGRPKFLHSVVKCPAKTEPFTTEDIAKVLANQSQESGIEGPGTDHPRRYESDYWDAIKQEFPYLLCAVGGDVNYLKVSEEGHADPCVLERSGYGGSSFYTLAQLATGNKDYNELLAMANRGNYKAASFSRPLNDLPERSMDARIEVNGVLDWEVALAGGTDKPVLLKPMENIRAGAAVAPDDIVASIMHMTCERIVTTAITLARKEGIRKVYFAGSFCDKNNILQQCIKNAPVYDMKNIGPEMYVGQTLHGFYAGVVGALMNGLYMMMFFVECGGMCRPPPPLPPLDVLEGHDGAPDAAIGD